MLRSHVLRLAILGLSVILTALWTSASGTESIQGQQPVVVEAVAPAYPIFLGNPNPSGRVDVRVQLNEEGRVTEAHAINGHPLLQLVAEPAAKRWRFEPTISNAQSRSALITFLFNIMPKGTPAEQMTTIFSRPYQIEVRRLPFERPTNRR